MIIEGFAVDQLVENQMAAIDNWGAYKDYMEVLPNRGYFEDFVRKTFTDFPFHDEQVKFFTMQGPVDVFPSNIPVASRAQKLRARWSWSTPVPPVQSPKLTAYEQLMDDMVSNYRANIIGIIEKDLEYLRKDDRKFTYCFAMWVPVYVVSKDPNFDSMCCGTGRMMIHYGKKVLPLD